MARKTILITGAAGRAGQLLRPLLQQSFNLRLVDIAEIAAPESGVEVRRGDLADPAFARASVSGVAGVVHLAGLVAPDASFEDTLNPNYRAVLALLDACRAEKVTRFVFASSHHIQGMYPSSLTYDATAAAAPDGFYALGKAFGEAACAMYAKRFGIATLVIRIGNADPQIVDGRRERLWVSGRDLAQLIEIGLDHPTLGFEIVYGISNCPASIFRNDRATQLGYQPIDRAEENHAPTFRALAELGATDGVSFVGGGFAVAALPNALERS